MRKKKKEFYEEILSSSMKKGHFIFTREVEENFKTRK